MSARLDSAVAELVEALRQEVEQAATRQPERLYDMAAAAQRMGIGRTTLYAEARGGRIRTLKVGRRRLVAAGAIEEFIAARNGGSGGGE